MRNLGGAVPVAQAGPRCARKSISQSQTLRSLRWGFRRCVKGNLHVAAGVLASLTDTADAGPLCGRSCSSSVLCRNNSACVLTSARSARDRWNSRRRTKSFLRQSTLSQRHDFEHYGIGGDIPSTTRNWTVDRQSIWFPFLRSTNCTIQARGYLLSSSSRSSRPPLLYQLGSNQSREFL